MVVGGGGASDAGMPWVTGYSGRRGWERSRATHGPGPHQALSLNQASRACTVASGRDAGRMSGHGAPQDPEACPERELGLGATVASFPEHHCAEGLKNRSNRRSRAHDGWLLGPTPRPRVWLRIPTWRPWIKRRGVEIWAHGRRNDPDSTARPVLARNACF